MLRLLTLALPLLSAALPAPPPARTGRKIIAGTLVCLCLLITLGCLLTSIWLFLAPIIGAAWTALAIAGLTLTIAILLTLGICYWPVKSPAPLPEVTTSALLAEAALAFSSHKAIGLAGALLLGELLGSLHEKRR